MEQELSMDKSYVTYVSSEDDSIKEKAMWLQKTAEERWFAIEFLRKQWIQMNDFNPVMDRTYFDYK